MRTVAAPQTTCRPGSRPGPAAGSRPDARRLPGLDGLRALAIIAVVVFHLDPTWLPGGFLGVDIFFVVSGFLITTLLLREGSRTGRVDLPAFWTRRARRLLPALGLCVVVSILLARLVEGDLLVGIGRQTLGALTFSSNWVEIAAGSDYFHATAPQLFMNFWSLAVEEQFYLLWPLVAMLLLAATRTTVARVRITLTIGLASALLMAWLWSPESATRAYYGTDSHLFGLMVGAALAFAYAAPHRAWTSRPAWGRWRRPVVAGAIVTLALLLWRLDEDAALTFRGGLPLASLATGGIILAAVSTPGRLRLFLEAPVLGWIGERSYGLYLWHWPVILLIDQDLDLAAGSASYLWSKLWAVLVTVAIADLSHRFLEMPVRRHGFRGCARLLAHRLRAGGPRRARLAAAAVAVVTLALAATLIGAPKRTSTEDMLATNGATANGGPARAGVVRTPATPAPTAAPGAGAAKPLPGPAQPVWRMPTGREVHGYGDSMLVGALGAMKYALPKVSINAASNRQWREAPRLLAAQQGGVRRAVVLAFGTNAGTDPAAIRTVLDQLGPSRLVVIVNLHGRISRIARDNAALADVVAGRRNVAVADWNAALVGTSGMLQSDGIHPSIKGARLYTLTVLRAFAQIIERNTGNPVTVADPFAAL